MTINVILLVSLVKYNTKPEINHAEQPKFFKVRLAVINLQYFLMTSFDLDVTLTHSSRQCYFERLLKVSI